MLQCQKKVYFMKQLEVTVDKRTELMAIVLALSECNMYAEEHFNLSILEDYRQKVLQHFHKFKNHKCIMLAKELGNKETGFNYDNPIRLAFEIEKDLSCDGEISQEILDELKDKKLLKEFLYSICDFAKETKFDDFYNSQKGYYQKKIDEIKQIFNINNFLPCMEHFFKTKFNNNFFINIIPTLINSNHGFIANGNCYANLGLLSEDFKKIELFNKGYSHIIIHEFLHSFVNENTNKNIRDIKLELVYQPNKNLQTMGYNNKISYINDTIVRALTIRLRKALDNIDDNKFLDKEASWGFVYIKDVYMEILNFEKQQLSWDKYYSNILHAFNKPLNKEIIKG